MADGDDTTDNNGIDPNVVNSINDSLSLMLNNLSNLNSSLTDQAKVTDKAADVMTDASKAAEGLGKGVGGYENKATEDTAKKGGFKGGVKGTIGLMADFGESLKNVQDRYVNDPKLNYFQKARRAEQVANIKSLISFRSALKRATMVLIGFLTKGIKVAFESFTGISQTAAAFGKSMLEVANFKTMTNLTSQGLSYNEATEGIQTAIQLGLDPSTKASTDLIRTTNLLGKSFKQYAGIAKRLSLVTGLSKNASVELMSATIATARKYGLDSDKLVQSIQELIPTLQKVALAQGAQAGEAYTGALSLLTAKLGPEFEQLTADVLQGIHGGKTQSFIMGEQLGVNTQGLMGDSAEGVVATLENMSVALSNLLNKMITENGYSNALAVSILAETFQISQNQMHSLTRMGEALGEQALLTPEEIEIQNAAVKEMVLQNDAMRALNTITQAVYVAIGEQLIPLVQRFGLWTQKNGKAIRSYLVDLVKFIPVWLKNNFDWMITSLGVIKGVLMSIGAVAAASKAVNALYHVTTVGLLATIAKGSNETLWEKAAPFLGYATGAVAAAAAIGTFVYARSLISDLSADFSKRNDSMPDAPELPLAPLTADVAESVASIDDKTADANASLADVFDNGQILASELQRRVLEELRIANRQREDIEDARIWSGTPGIVGPLNQ
tara:strand:+ start:1577 stop:3586 length:2010 start_codon:yes stop_codon:yes gene_type:complete